MLPLWWPRFRCVYCGRRIYGGYQARVRRARAGDLVPELLACPRHLPLVSIDPGLA